MFALVALLAPASWSASIGLFSDAGYSSCDLAILPGATGTFYVVAVDADNAPLCCGPGLTGAAFSISGLPVGWMTTVTPSPQAVVAIGNPFTGGAYLAFQSAQYGYTILLYTITVTATPPTSSAMLTVQAPSEPFPWSSIYCPYISGTGGCPCDPDAACVTGGAFYINASGDCLLAVAPVTWSQVRMLYD
jgi:hypothetical protein